MGWTCSTYGGKERFMQGFGGETWGKETTWNTQALDGRIILRWLFRKWDLAQDWDRWRALVNAAVNPRVP
jgi:hypothetical protein